MEKFYIVTDQSPLRQQYLDYVESNAKIREFYITFAKKFGIEAEKFAPTETVLGVVPTKHDSDQFAKQFCKNSDGKTGLRFFKLRSAVNKDWVGELKESQIKILRKPSLSWELGIFGKCWTRLFTHGDTVYASLESEKDFKDPAGFLAIPGSQFYKIIEEIEAAEQN
mgnify:CR=1 FL=1